MTQRTNRIAPTRRLGLQTVRGAWQRLSMALMLVMLTTSTAWAVEDTTFPLTNGQTWTNTTTNTRYTVSGTEGNLTLTVSVADANVNDGKGTIADEAFHNKDIGDVKTIAIDAGITSIGINALTTWPRNYTTVTFAENSQLTTIAKGAFFSCASLTSINLGDCLMLESIGDSAFNSCTGLTTLDLSGCTLLTSIGRQAFFRCTNLTITIPKGLTIGDNAFTDVKQVNQVGITLDGLTYNETDGCFDIGNLTEFQTFLTYANGVSGTNQCKNLTFRLTANIDMTGQTYTPIPLFAGTFNGNNKTITGLTGSNGLFKGVGLVGSVTDLTLSGVNIISNGDYIGGIAGSCNGVIERCHVTGSISGQYKLGGIAGQLNKNNTSAPVRISDCTFSGTITGTEYRIGGITGYSHGTITGCTVSNATITTSYNTELIAGIAGYLDKADGDSYPEISDCTAIGVTVTSQGNYRNAIYGAIDSGIDASLCTLSNNNAYYSVKAGDYVTITYQSGDKTTVGGTDYYKAGATFTLSHADRPGYVFGGYQTTPAATIDNGTLTLPETNVTVTATLTAIPWSGTGTEGDPWVIEYPSQLDLLATNVNGGTTYENTYFVLANDITYSHTTDWDDATSTENNYTAIGYYDGSNYYDFKGHFDGRGHTVSGIRIYKSGSDATDAFQGIFGYTDGATIQNITLADTRITGYQATGGIVGYNKSGGTVSDCHVTADVTIHAVQSGASIHGGIVGYNIGTVSYCTSAATLTNTNGGSGYGGIVGCNDGTLSNNLAIGAVVPSASWSCYGAICGDNDKGTLRHNYYYHCTVAGAVNTTTMGCHNANVTTNNGAVSGNVLYDKSSKTGINSYILTEVGNNADVPRVKLAGRTLYKDGYWNTLTLPFAVSNFAGTPLEDATVKELLTTSNLNNGTLTLNFGDDLTAIEAGKPYIVKWATTDSNIENPVFTGVTIDDTKRNVTFTGGTFMGNYAPLEITDANRDDIVVLAGGNKLGYVTTDRTIANGKALGAFHAYFEIPGSTQAREFVLNTDDGETTGIVDNKRETITNNHWYSLDGRKLQGKPTQKGLYIVNGKVRVIK